MALVKIVQIVRETYWIEVADNDTDPLDTAQNLMFSGNIDPQETSYDDIELNEIVKRLPTNIIAHQAADE
jgi:hypothetical protein